MHEQRGSKDGQFAKATKIKIKNSLGVNGGEAQLDQSSTGNFSVFKSSSHTSLAPSKPSRPENMGFSGVASMSQLPGLPITLPDVDRGGVEG